MTDPQTGQLSLEWFMFLQNLIAELTLLIQLSPAAIQASMIPPGWGGSDDAADGGTPGIPGPMGPAGIASMARIFAMMGG